MVEDKKAELLALADRCEAATGPDRELDGTIDRLLHRRPKNGDYDEGERSFWLVDGWSGLLVRSDGFARESFCAADYTTSLDAAYSLIPEGWHVGCLTECDEDDKAHCCLTENSEPYRDIAGDGVDMITSLLAASLRAHAAQLDQ